MAWVDFLAQCRGNQKSDEPKSGCGVTRRHMGNGPITVASPHAVPTLHGRLGCAGPAGRPPSLSSRPGDREGARTGPRRVRAPEVGASVIKRQQMGLFLTPQGPDNRPDTS